MIELPRGRSLGVRFRIVRSVSTHGSLISNSAFPYRSLDLSIVMSLPESGNESPTEYSRPFATTVPSRTTAVGVLNPKMNSAKIAAAARLNPAPRAHHQRTRRFRAGGRSAKMRSRTETGTSSGANVDRNADCTSDRPDSNFAEHSLHCKAWRSRAAHRLSLSSPFRYCSIVC